MRATPASRKNNTSNNGFGSLRRSFHTMMLIDPILRAGDSANESAGKAPSRAGLELGAWHTKGIPCRLIDR